MTTLPEWDYRGRDWRGRVVRGRIEAPSQSAVVQRMRGMGLTPVKVQQRGQGIGLDREIVLPGIARSRPKPKALAMATRQLATMLGAGLPLLRALAVLETQTEDRALRRAFTEVRERVERGNALSDALAAQPSVFPPLMVHMVRAGESGGFLDRALDSIADSADAEVKLRQKIKAALTYPAVMLVIAIIGVIAMLVFVVPVFEQMFAEMGGDLPLPTAIMLGLSRNMYWIGPLLIVLILAAVLWWRRYRYSDAVRRVTDPFVLRLWIIGNVVRKLSIARFTRNFATMMLAGVPLLRALEIVAETSGNWVIREAILDVRDRVRTGTTIADAMSRHEVFPQIVTQMIAVGEDSGALETMLERVADSYDAEVETTTEQLTSLIEPITIVVLGLIIGGMVVSLYLPLFGIYGQIAA